MESKTLRLGQFTVYGPLALDTALSSETIVHTCTKTKPLQTTTLLHIEKTKWYSQKKDRTYDLYPTACQNLFKMVYNSKIYLVHRTALTKSKA